MFILKRLDAETNLVLVLHQTRDSNSQNAGAYYLSKLLSVEVFDQNLLLIQVVINLFYHLSLPFLGQKYPNCNTVTGLIQVNT